MPDFSFQEEPSRVRFDMSGRPTGLTGFVMDLLKTDDEAKVQKVLMVTAAFFILATLFVILF